jgi:hypothetical protein
MRALLALLILILTIASSGISSAIASTIGGDDDCCVDGAEDGAPEPRSDGDGADGGGADGGGADGDGDRCPPLCHGCACSPAFSVPTSVAIVWVVRVVEHRRTVHSASQLPTSPFGEGVFHPPRRLA